MRCLVVETDGRKILIDAGLGTKQDEKFMRFYYLNGNNSLENSLLSSGISNDEKTKPLMEHSCIRYIEGNTFLYSQVEIRLFYGHTAGLAIPILHVDKGKTLVYAA